MNHCKICGNNIPDGTEDCHQAGFGEGCMKTMRNMTNFIETQKELAREEMRGMYYDDSDEFPRLLDTLITQVIQNTIEEVGRRAEPDNTVSLIAQAIRERDTYWKETNQVFVNNIIEDIENMKGVYSAQDAITKALEIIKRHTIR